MESHSRDIHEITLICISNNDDFRNNYDTSLQQLGYRVHHANKASATEQLLETADLIIFDAQLLNHQCKLSRSSLLTKIPVIIFDMRENIDLLDLCLHSGMDDYLVHPINPAALAIKINLLINSYRMSFLADESSRKAEAMLEKVQQSEQLLQETSLASHIFYNYLLGKKEPTLPSGFSRHIHYNTDFSGDLILAQNTPLGNTLVFHADATGHGMASTMTLIPITHIFRAMAAKSYSIENIIKEMNRALSDQLPDDRFVAATLTEIDWHQQQIAVWNGGMPGVHLLDERGNIRQSFKSRNTALSVLNNNQQAISVEYGFFRTQDRLIGFSDGLTEQFSADQQTPFGEQRALDLISKTSAEDLPEQLIGALQTFSGKDKLDDDLSFFTLQMCKAGAARQPIGHYLQVTEQRQPPFEWSYCIYGKLISDNEIPGVCYNILSSTLDDKNYLQRIHQIICQIYQSILDLCILRIKDDRHTIKGNSITEFVRRRNFLIRNIPDETMIGVKLAMRNKHLQPSLKVDFAHNGKPLTAAAMKQGLLLNASRLCKGITLENNGTKVSCLI